MRWVYVLKCEDDYYYVGETKRLYRRFWEHIDGFGGLNTSIYKPTGIVAIYKVNTLGKFFEYNNNVIDTINKNDKNGYNKWLLKDFDDDDDDEYDNLYAENNITECLMIYNKDNWKKIRGGKYTKFIEYNFPVNEYIKELPMCNCGLPCDIKKNQNKNYLYFRCSKKNMWNDFKKQFDIEEEPCNFYMEYIKDLEFRLNENTKFEDRCKTLKELFKKSYWLKNVSKYDDYEPEVCIGGCNKGYSYSKVSYNYKELNLCYDCFINKNEELSKKYKLKSECLIKL